MWRYGRVQERRVSILDAMEARARTVREALARAGESVKRQRLRFAPRHEISKSFKAIRPQKEIRSRNSITSVASRRQRGPPSRAEAAGHRFPCPAASLRQFVGANSLKMLLGAPHVLGASTFLGEQPPGQRFWSR